MGPVYGGVPIHHKTYWYISTFSAFFSKGGNFVTSYLLPWTLNPKIGLLLKIKNAPEGANSFL